MKLSWTSLKISIAGAKLSHFVQKDRIWDHGSMTEQARIIFYLVQKAKTHEDAELLKKQCSVSCFEKLKMEIQQTGSRKVSWIPDPIVKEIAITDVQHGKRNRFDMFRVIIRGVSKEDPPEKFKAHCSFVRQGEWWVLDKIMNKKI
jgi:hypothetical protein